MTHPVFRCERLGWRRAGYSEPLIRSEDLRLMLGRELRIAANSTKDLDLASRLGVRLFELSGVTACDFSRGRIAVVNVEQKRREVEQAHALAHALLLRWGRPHSESDALHLAHELLLLARDSG